jgi:hypothetical protein
MNSPGQPCNEAARVVAYNDFARLVQAASKQVNSGIRDSLRGETYITNAKANVMGIKKCLAGMLLVWKTRWLKGRQNGANPRQTHPRTKNGGEESDVQDGYVREEEADEQRTERCRYCGAVDSPRRWLLEDTRSASPRREQVATCKRT